MKGLVRSLSRGSPARQEIVRQRVPINTTLSFLGITDTVVRQQAVLGDLPEGNILLLGAIAYLKLTGPTSGNLTDDFEGNFSVGSAPNADTSLSGAEVDLIPNTDLGPATSEATPTHRAANATQVMLDNTDGSLEINLNVTLDANEVTNAATVVITATGYVELAYIVLSDD